MDKQEDSDKFIKLSKAHDIKKASIDNLFTEWLNQYGQSDILIMKALSKLSELSKSRFPNEP